VECTDECTASWQLPNKADRSCHPSLCCDGGFTVDPDAIPPDTVIHGDGTIPAPDGFNDIFTMSSSSACISNYVIKMMGPSFSADINLSTPGVMEGAILPADSGIAFPLTVYYQVTSGNISKISSTF